jgi:hypothetical protein
MGGSGKGGNNRRNRQRFSGRKGDSHSQKQDSGRSRDGQGWNSKKAGENLFIEGKLNKSRLSLYERPSWTAPKLPTDPLPIPNCPWCGNPIKDISTAISDKNTGLPVHFDCVLARLGKEEILESNEAVCYIGGGRFGVIHYNNLPDTKDFKIKRIFEWENKDNRSEWRRDISAHFSVT